MSTTLRRRPRDAAGNAASADDARELARLVGECAAAAIGRSALALRLSLLPRERTQPHHLRLARAAVDPLTSADRARLFELGNRDIVVVWRGDAAETVLGCRRAIDHLFGDEPAEGHEAAGDSELLQLLTLPADARVLLEIVEASLAPEPGPPQAAGPAVPPLDLHSLGALEAALQQSDVARFARRRPVCSLLANGGMHLAWEKRLLSIEELTAALLPDRAPRADPWLFRRLTRTLDRRMLALLSHPEELRQAGTFSLNLNVASILSPEFLRFDAALPARLRGEVILELLPADVVADPAAFLFAREFTRVRGYALLLRGLSPTLLRMFPRELVGVQWLQLRWSAEMATRPSPLAGVDPAHVVLGSADTAAAILWGHAQGIGHFCGGAAQPG